MKLLFMSKILVSGCAGFIGSHLCERLLRADFDVVGVDSLTDYYDPAIKKSHLERLLRNPNFEFRQEDLLRVETYQSALDDAVMVFHLAAQPGVRGSWGNSFDTYVRNNILATQKLLEAARTSRELVKFVYASSSSVYGQIQTERVTEEYRTQPHSPYGVTKLAAEHLCSLYYANYGLPTISLRFFTVYGPRQRPDMAFHRLVKAALTGQAFPVYGDGTQERDFTFVGDIVEGLVLAALHPTATGVYNIGGGHVVSLNEVIQLIEDMTGSPIKRKQLEAQVGDVKRTGADTGKIQSVLGYRPKTPLRDGLRAEVDYFAALLNVQTPSATGNVI
jgi:UDP-glucose 4-epimerase